MKKVLFVTISIFVGFVIGIYTTLLAPMWVEPQNSGYTICIELFGNVFTSESN